MNTRNFDFGGSVGQRLAGRLDLPDETPKGYAVFAHCFTCTKNSLAATRIARSLTARGIGVLRFDFTGLGGSEGQFGEGGFSADVDDLRAAIAQMESEGVVPQLLIGHSFGGAAALAAASMTPGIKAVAAIAAPYDVKHVAGHLRDELQTIIDQGEARVTLGGRPFTVRRSFVQDLDKHDQGARIAALRRPLLILHSPTDSTVDVGNATAIFMAAKHPKSFVSLHDADHLLTRPRDAEYAAEVIAAWASRYLD